MTTLAIAASLASFAVLVVAALHPLINSEPIE